MKTTIASFPALVQSFFTERLQNQRRASPHTLAAYRDSFRLLFHFAKDRLGKPPSRLGLEDLDAPFIGNFLDHVEKKRGNGARSRNLRLSAIRSFFRYLAFQEPAWSDHIQRVLAIPSKKHDRPVIDFLIRSEIEALLAAPNPKTWIGRRDHACLLVALQTGLRLSELTQLRWDNVTLGPSAHLRCHGKGRKERCTPLTPQTARALKAWRKEEVEAQTPLVFPSSRGGPLSPDAVQWLLAKYVQKAQTTCPSLKSKQITPHVLRHTTAMELLQAGVDRSVIALWLGHENVETTQVYLNAHMALKEQALAKITPPRTKTGRYRPDDKLLRFLQDL